MPGTKKQQPVVALHTTLLEGLTVKSRADGSVHTVKANGKVVGEVCVGTKRVRLNLREPVTNAPKPGGVSPRSGAKATQALS